MRSPTRRRFLVAAVGAAATFATLNVAAGPASAADSPYKGKTVRFITQRSVHQNALAAEMEAIAKEWGINFEVRQVTAAELAKKVLLDYVAGADTWDIMYTGGVQRMYEWYGRGAIEDLSPIIKKVGDPKVLGWEELSKSDRDAVTFQGKILGIPLATSDQTMAYRKDLFENAEERSAFKAKYGYDLAPPETYKQYLDIATFFTRKKGEKLAGKVRDKDFYGTVMPNKKGVYIFHNYENLALAYGFDIYNPETRKADILSKQGIAAASFMKALVPLMPKGHINMANAEATASFVSGDVALYVEYFDRVVGTVARDTPVSEAQVGYALPPSVEDNPKGLKNAFRSGPAVLVVSSLSKNKEAAYKLLEAVASSKTQLAMARKYPGFMPSKIPALKEFAKEKPVVGYLSHVLEDPNIAAVTDAGIMPYPSILKSAEISDAIGSALQAILIGGSVEPEMKKAQAKLNEIYATLPK